MPGYPRQSNYAAPEPTEIVKTVEKRFVMPKITLIQIILIGVVVAYAYTARKMNGTVVGSIALTIALLHMYDHLFLIKRGSEKSIFAPSKETYALAGSMLRESLLRKTEGYACQACK